MNRRRLMLTFGGFAVVLLATVFRFYALDAVPPGLFIDEAQNGVDIEAIRQGARPVFIVIDENLKGRSREPLFHYIAAGVFDLLGSSRHSLRATSAVIGVATVAALYLLCLRVFGARVALFAAAFLAMMRWHVTFSRIGLRSILVPLVAVLVLLALERFGRTRSVASGVVLGVLVGLGFYTYPAFWIVPPLALGIGWLACGSSGVSFVRANGVALASMTAVFLLTIAPLGSFALEQPETFFARAAEVTDSAPGRPEPSWVEQGQQLLFMLHFRGDPEARHNIPGAPQLDPIQGVAFVLGLAALAASRRWPLEARVGVVLFWLLPLLPSVVSEGAPHAMRALGSAPAVAVVAAVGVVHWAERAVALVSRAVPGAHAVALAGLSALLVASAAVNARDLESWGKLPEVHAGFSADIPLFYAFLEDLGRDADVFASPYVRLPATTRFLAIESGQDVLQPLEGQRAFEKMANSPRDRVIVSENLDLNALLLMIYPQAEVIGRFSVHSARNGRVFRVPSVFLREHLTPREDAAVRHFSGRMAAAFGEQAKRW